jgi:hypothetical protein
MDAVTGIFATVPLDWFILGGILIVIALDTLRSGLGRAVALSIALVGAVVLHALIGKTIFVGSLDALSSPMIQGVVFGVIVVALFFLIRRMGLDYVESGMGEPIQAILAGAATAIVLAVIWLQIPELNALWQLGSQAQAIFAEQFRLFWLLGAFAALAFARG